MTQWNDQAPLSRRQARERERHGDGSLPASAISAASPVEPEPSVALPFGSAVEPAAALPGSAQQPGSAVDGSGERSRGRRASAASVDGIAAAPGPASVASAAEPGLRRRDARSRGTAAASRDAAAEPTASQPVAPPDVSAFTAASAAEPGSRRARRAAEQARPEPQVAPSAPITDSQWAAVTQRGSAAEPGERPAPSFWSDTAARDAAPQAAPEWAPPALLPGVPPVATSTDRTSDPVAAPLSDPPPQPATASEQSADERVSDDAVPDGAEPEDDEPANAEPSDAEEPQVRRRGTWQAPDQPAERQQTTAPQPFQRHSEPAAAPAEERPAPPAAETIVPPVGPGVGHWSRQSQSEDDTQGGTGAIGRGMGFASPLNSTNSLVLPSIPEPGGNLTGPLGDGGEVLLTGSMELPRSLGSSGADPRRYDTSEVDRLFETGDYEEVSTDSTPVLAARAISSHSATRGLVAAQKPRGGTRFPTALAIGAGVAAIVVVGLFVVMVVTGVFTN